MAIIPTSVRKVLKPLIPRRVRDRVKQRRLGSQVTSNVDVIVGGKLRAWRWRATTPSTYRVGVPSPAGPTTDTVFIPPGDPKGLATLVGAGVDVVVAANASPPSWLHRGSAARIEPIAMAVSAHALDDVGGSSADAVPDLFSRLDQAGHRLAVVPTGRRPRARHRLDPFDEPAAVVLGAVPLRDVGGGSRGAQLTMELLARGYRVAYVTRYASSGSSGLGLRHIHPRLEQYAYDDFDASSYSARARSSDRIAVCEIPVRDYVRDLVALRGAAFEVIYDRIDDWSDAALGLDWYEPEVERAIIDASSALVASAETLVEQLGSGGRSVTLVPNGVNDRLFTGDVGELPPDLPEARPLLGYHGSLYGDWFDWDAVVAVAEAYPQGVVVIIGDADEPPPLPSNVRFLGAKPQFQLPAYVGRYDVGLIPFTVTPTTHAVSPLKAFESLAMGMPVAGPPLRALEGIAGVHVADSLPDAVASALDSPRPDGLEARRVHGWGDRIGRLLGAIGKELPPLADPMPRVELRPFVRYQRSDRRLG